MNKYIVLASLISVLGGVVNFIFSWSGVGFLLSVPMHYVEGVEAQFHASLFVIVPFLMIITGVRLFRTKRCSYLAFFIVSLLAYLQFMWVVGALFAMIPLLSIFVFYLGRKITWVPDELKDKLSK